MDIVQSKVGSCSDRPRRPLISLNIMSSLCILLPYFMPQSLLWVCEMVTIEGSTAGDNTATQIFISIYFIKGGRSSFEEGERAIRNDMENPITCNSQRVAPRNSSLQIKLIEPLGVATDSIERSSNAGGEGTVINIVIEDIHTTNYQQLLGIHFDMSMSTRDLDRVISNYHMLLVIVRKRMMFILKVTHLYQ